MNVPQTTRQCNNCCKTKPLIKEFWRQNADGTYRKQCRDCGQAVDRVAFEDRKQRGLGQLLALVPTNALQFFDGDLVNLTAMWRASGSERNKNPGQWIIQQATQDFIAELCRTYKVVLNHFVTLRSLGKTRSTWAHWQVAAAYAKYLSPAFHIQWNEYAAAYLRGDARPCTTVITTPAPPQTNRPDSQARLAAIAGELLELVHDEIHNTISQAIAQHLGLMLQQVAETHQVVQGVAVLEREVTREIKGEDWVANGYCYLFFNRDENIISIGQTHRGADQRLRDTGYNQRKSLYKPWEEIWSVQTDNRKEVEKLLHNFAKNAGAVHIAGDMFHFHEQVVTDFCKLPRQLRHKNIRAFVNEAELFVSPLFIAV